MEQEESIDLDRLCSIAWQRRKVVGGIVAGCTALALAVSFTMPKQWESTALVQTRSAGQNLGGAAAMAAAMGINIGGGSGSPLNYIEMMKSRRVLEPIIDSLEWEDEEDKPDAEQFAKKVLKIENTKQTNLITVAARGKTPEEAQQIAQSVVDNFLLMQTDMNQQTQSILVKFLNGRIETAKKESDEAAQQLADYSKEQKIYSPSDQATEAITELVGYDKAIANLQVSQQSAQAEYDTATQKLGEQKAGSRAYAINDNETVQSIRSQIVAKEVQLVGLRQKFTEEHPDVKAAEEQLKELNNSLVNEVNAIVSSNAASINSVQMNLLQSQAVASAKLAAASASETAVRERLAQKEAEMESFPEKVMNYMKLQRDAGIKQEVFTTLVKQCEQNKIQEAMESMDIQIIDPANLPDEDKPSGPRRKLIAAIGFVLGCMLSFGYSLVVYRREA